MNKSEDFWDSASANYDKTEGQFEYIHQKSRELAKTHLSKLDRVLDYGCGTGTTACALAGHVSEIEGIDISGMMIEIAKEKAAADSIKNIEFSQADIFDERFEKGSYDVILAFNMLHTVSEPSKVVAQIYQLLKPSGVFISVTPCLGGRLSFLVSIQILIMRIMIFTHVIPVPIRRLKSRDVDELVVSEDFEALETEIIYKGASSYFVSAKKNAK